MPEVCAATCGCEGAVVFKVSELSNCVEAKGAVVIIKFQSSATV